MDSRGVEDIEVVSVASPIRLSVAAPLCDEVEEGLSAL